MPLPPQPRSIVLGTAPRAGHSSARICLRRLASTKRGSAEAAEGSGEKEMSSAREEEKKIDAEMRRRRSSRRRRAPRARSPPAASAPPAPLATTSRKEVPGLLRKNNYGERFERLMDCATWIFNKLLTRAANTPRNFIIDQTNVYKNARIRKLRPFANYRKTAVVMFPTPSELKSRAAKRFNEMGKEIPAEAVNEMTANFVLPLSKDMPHSKEPFDEVIFTELSRDEAQRTLDDMQRVLPRNVTPSYGNSGNQKHYSSTYAGTAAPLDPSARSSMPGFYPPTANSYGVGDLRSSAATFSTGVHTEGNTTHGQTPCSVRSFRSPTGNQHGIHSSYPSAPNQYQMPSSYLSNSNQYEVRASYRSTPLPGYGQSTYASRRNPSPYNSEMHQGIQAPMSSRNLYRAPGSAEAYVAPCYAAGNLIGRPHQVLSPSTFPAHGPQPAAQWVPNQGSSRSWSSDSYRPYYGQ